MPDKVDGDAAGTYLKRRQSWKDLNTLLQKTQGSNITCYSFRHPYSLRGHRLNIDGGSMATAMEHNYKTYWQAYPFVSKSEVDAAFNLAKK